LKTKKKKCGTTPVGNSFKSTQKKGQEERESEHKPNRQDLAQTKSRMQENLHIDHHKSIRGDYGDFDRMKL